jgi:hypothetical protein
MADPTGLGAHVPPDDELLRSFGKAKRDFCYEGPIDDWPKRAELAATDDDREVIEALDL